MPHPTTRPSVLLTAYDVRRCQRRVHLDHDPSLDRVAWEPPAELQARFDAGREHEADVLARLREVLAPSRWRDLSGYAGRQATMDATVLAMAEGVEVVIGGWLPDDEAGARSGRPDLLVRVGGGYVPGDVKWHRTTKASKRGRLAWSMLDAPAEVRYVEGLAARTSDRRDDHLQLAHYWRMLEAAGYAAAGPARGFVVGTDTVEDEPALVWLELDAPLFTTFSRSRGRARRTALEHYDFEHAIRRALAEDAEAGVAGPLPIFTDECATCPWLASCREVAGDAASAHVTVGRLDVREWRALAGLGVVTTDQLAGLDVGAVLVDYLPEVTHQPQAEERLAVAVRRARMVRDGVALERETYGAVPVPRADVEVDFDLEDAGGRVYLWGALVREDGVATYHPHVSWAPLDDASERGLALAFVTWLRELRRDAEARGRTLRAYHYAAYELTHLERILGPVDDLREVCVDLYDLVREHYFGVAGLGLKKVAPAFGFAWRDDEPSGLASQGWYAEARGSGAAAEAARTRLLAYNEDDVLATAVVRDAMSR
jgi:predicted RecB family nuclease